ncbi:MAG: glycosyltransferase family 4 protein, partial [Candidatus Binataceae bacterium]
MSRVLDVAILSPTPSHPLDYGNRKRIHAVCAALAERGARIRFLLYPLEDEWRYMMPRDACKKMRDAWHDFQIIPPSISYHARAKGTDHTIDEWWDPALESFLKWYFERTPVDAFIVNYVYLSKALQLAPQNCLKVLDTHDRVSGRRERLAELGIEREWFHTTAEEEAIGIARADLILAIKPEEAPFFESVGSAPVITLPFIEKRVDWVREPSDQSEYLRIGMLGARNSINVRSATRFLNQAIPRFRDFMAPVKIVLAGTMCADLEEFAHIEDVEIFGALRDLGEFYKAIDVVVGPVEHSTGQKIRIGEALAFGLPIISHAHTFEGYPPMHPWHRLADIDSVIGACIDLAFDQSELAALRAASERSYSRQVALIEAAVDLLVERIARFAAADVFIVDVAKLVADPLLARHIAAMAHAAAASSKVLILLDGEPNDACCALIRLTQSFARVWATGEIPSGFEFPETEKIGSVDAIFARFRVGNVWLYGSADHLKKAERDTTFVLAPGLTDVALGGAGLEGHAFPAEGLLCFGKMEHGDTGSAFRVDDVMSV